MAKQNAMEQQQQQNGFNAMIRIHSKKYVLLVQSRILDKWH